MQEQIAGTASCRTSDAVRKTSNRNFSSKRIMLSEADQ